MSNDTPKQLEMPLFEVRIPLSKTGKYAGLYEAIVSLEDKDLAELNWSVAHNENSDLRYAQGYISIGNGKQKTILMHRVILERMLGRKLEKREFPDHRDNNPLNNRRENLRLATYNENARNRRIARNNSTGYKGVSYRKDRCRWIAYIAVNGKKIHLGFFDTPEDAHKAYCEASDKYFGEFANYGGE